MSSTPRQPCAFWDTIIDHFLADYGDDNGNANPAAAD
jgi:hypothetical protein